MDAANNRQITSTVLMVRPSNFGFNPETADNNFYQQKDGRDSEELKEIVLGEFDGMVALLRAHGIRVLVVEDTKDPAKPDAVFPNNWFSTHEDGRILLYPMFSPLRRRERRKDILELLLKEGFSFQEVVDMSFFEHDGQFLEGTGSLVLDREAKVAYACWSERTNPLPLEYFARLMGYERVTFHAEQEIQGVKSPIYHTNVMMHVGSNLAVVCLDSVAKHSEKQSLKDSLQRTGKKIIPITTKQKFNFAGNMLELENKEGRKFTVMSDTAFQSLTTAQKKTIEKYTRILAPQIPTIEKIGGGSVRCMMAEIFLPSVH